MNDLKALEQEMAYQEKRAQRLTRLPPKITNEELEAHKMRVTQRFGELIRGKK